MSKKTKILLIAGSIFIILLLIVVVSVQRDTKEGYLVEREGLPQEEWPSRVTHEEVEDGIIATNHYYGYRTRFPDIWMIDDMAFPYDGFSAYIHRNDDAEYFLTPEDGVHLNIRVFDKGRRSVMTWLASSEDVAGYFPPDATFELYDHPAGRTYKTSYPIPVKRLFWVEAGHVHDHDVKTEDVYDVENGVVEYIIEGNSSVFIISCTSAGGGYEEYLSLCEDVVPSFEIL